MQYASSEYVAELKSHGFLVSMARAGNPYENTRMESFFKTLKYEEVYLCEYETFEDIVARPCCVKINCYRNGSYCVINHVTEAS